MSKDFSVEQVQSLMECVAKNKLGELLIETEGLKLRIKGQCAAPPAVQISGGTMSADFAPTSAPVAVVTDAAMPPSVSECRCIASPIVGTFYTSSGPDREPFVKVGSQVNEGDTVFIIESMKVMNEVPADKSGVVAEIMLKSGSPVEYGQPIIRLE